MISFRIPPPQRSNGLSAQEIPLKFPSNHPFTSHISEKAVFPDPNSDENNRPSTDLEPYIVTHKVRGNPFRREVHFQGFVRNEKTKWPDKQYMQVGQPQVFSLFESFNLASSINERRSKFIDLPMASKNLSTQRNNSSTNNLVETNNSNFDFDSNRTRQTRFYRRTIVFACKQVE